MSRFGQTAAPLVPVPLRGRTRGVAFDYRPDEHIAPHRHDAAQLIYAVAGVMTVHTGAGTWVVPAERAVWVPPGEPHGIRLGGRVAMRTVYVRARSTRGMPQECAVVHVGPLLRALIVRIVEAADAVEPSAAAKRIEAVFFDECRAAKQAPLHLPHPADPRLQRVTDAILADPSDRRTLDDWSNVAGASARTLARLFVAETRMTFGSWTKQARLLAALERLALGRTVTETALEVGYDSPSAFVAMFRRALGCTPGRYFSSDEV